MLPGDSQFGWFIKASLCLKSVTCSDVVFVISFEFYRLIRDYLFEHPFFYISFAGRRPGGIVGCHGEPLPEPASQTAGPPRGLIQVPAPAEARILSLGVLLRSVCFSTAVFFSAFLSRGSLDGYRSSS